MSQMMFKFCEIYWYFVAAIDGDFDFCQLAVKQLLTDSKFQRELLEKYNIRLRQV